MQNGLVIPDTNVLLDFYRYQKQTRNDLLGALESMATLWVPNQVLREFWKNRLTTIRDSREATPLIIEKLTSQGDPIVATIGEWVNMNGAKPEVKEELAEIIRAAVRSVTDRLTQIESSEADEIPEETYRDPVLSSLESLLDGRVGLPYSFEREEEEKREAQRRIKLKIPPGFSDKDKGETPEGDYLVWSQILDEAEKSDKNVLLITRDQKPDWWRKSGSNILGPRGELVRELMARTNGKGRLFLLTPKRFLGWTQSLFGVSVSEGTIGDIERVDSQLSGKQAASWTKEELDLFDGLLDQSDGRSPIEQLPEGESQEGYFDVLVRICQIVGEDQVEFEDFINEFQRIFPNLSVRSEAKRRASCLFKLDLARRSRGSVALTQLGLSLASEPDLLVLQKQFVERIKGARELLAVCLESGGISSVRAKLRSEVPPGMTLNQATLVLRWLEQLSLT